MCHHRGFRIILCCFSEVAHKVIIVYLRWILIILLFQHVGQFFCWLSQHLLMCPCRSCHSKCILRHRSFYTALMCSSYWKLLSQSSLTILYTLAPLKELYLFSIAVQRHHDQWHLTEERVYWSLLTVSESESIIVIQEATQ